MAVFPFRRAEAALLATSVSLETFARFTRLHTINFPLPQNTLPPSLITLRKPEQRLTHAPTERSCELYLIDITLYRNSELLLRGSSSCSTLSGIQPSCRERRARKLQIEPIAAAKFFAVSERSRSVAIELFQESFGYFSLESTSLSARLRRENESCVEEADTPIARSPSATFPSSFRSDHTTAPQPPSETQNLSSHSVKTGTSTPLKSLSL